MNIYQEIWNADMKGNGLKPILPEETGDESQGYVVVDTKNCNPQQHIIQKVVIPKEKEESYRLVEKLFNNYSLDESKNERNTLDESKEVEQFLDMAIKSEPLKIAKKYIEEKANHEYTYLQWYTYLHDIWFRQFNSDNGRDLSGFEHIFIGEEKGRTLNGYHFWYKYYIDDSILNDQNKDEINLICSIRPNETSPKPDVVTIAYTIDAYDYEQKRFVKLVKAKGGFFVGLSAEGLLALGTVRFTPQAFAEKDAVINNIHYELKLFRSNDTKSMRTFYPVYH